MNKKISLGAAIVFMVIASAVTFTLTMAYSLNMYNLKVANVNDREAIYDKIAEIDRQVRLNYVGDIDSNVLLDSIADGYIAGLGDNYATYYSEEELKDHKQSLEGIVVGIGIQATLDDSGYIRIIKVYEGSSAEEMGLLKGDLIVKVNDEDVKAKGYNESISLLKGEAGSVVKATIRRDDKDEDKEITRKKVEIPSIYYELHGDNAYIKIEEFNSSTVEQFNAALKKAEEDQATGIIFDLRNNTGGTLDSVKTMLDTLLPECDIVSKTDSEGNTEVMYTSDANEIKLPMVTIANNKTASAAELFVAALRDLNKAKMVGVTTYGKGVMQSLIQLNDGSAINITTAYFNPPSGVNFNGVGIEPDFEVALSTDNDKLFVNGDLAKEEDDQFLKAVEVLNASK